MDNAAPDRRPEIPGRMPPPGRGTPPRPRDHEKPSWLREAEERLRKHRSLLETLTDEDWEFLRAYDGPEVLGPPPPPPMPRRPRRRGEP